MSNRKKSMVTIKSRRTKETHTIPRRQWETMGYRRSLYIMVDSGSTDRRHSTPEELRRAELLRLARRQYNGGNYPEALEAAKKANDMAQTRNSAKLLADIEDKINQ